MPWASGKQGQLGSWPVGEQFNLESPGLSDPIKTEQGTLWQTCVQEGWIFPARAKPVRHLPPVSWPLQVGSTSILPPAPPLAHPVHVSLNSWGGRGFTFLSS